MHDNCLKNSDLYEQAELSGTWSSLVPYPCLLLRYQRKHPLENRRIATVSSHKLGNHIWCDTPDKCKTVDNFIIQHSSGQHSLIQIDPLPII